MLVRFLGFLFIFFSVWGCTNTQRQGSHLSETDSVMSCAMSSIPSRFSRVSERDSLRHQTGEDKVAMVYIEGGTFIMGSKNFPDALPLHEVEVSSFYIDEHEVTNAQFEEFVKATGYITVAEKELDPREFLGADPALLVP